MNTKIFSLTLVVQSAEELVQSLEAALIQMRSEQEFINGMRVDEEAMFGTCVPAPAQITTLARTE